MQGLVTGGVPALTFDPVKQRYIDVNGREYLPDELEQDDDELEFGESTPSMESERANANQTPPPKDLRTRRLQ